MSFDSLQLRNALGRFATGVCVITASPEGHAPFGMTVNSFSSLSLTPPLVLWSLQKNSDTMEAFRVARQYCVNILSQEQKALSGRYAKKGDHALRAEEFTIGESGLPVLRHSLASFECDMDARHDGGGLQPVQPRPACAGGRGRQIRPALARNCRFARA